MTEAPTAALEIDHVFVFVDRNGPERDALERAGLVASYRRHHSGQGTANVCYCFDNTYLELLWEEDGREIRSPMVSRTGLAERAAWRHTGASPFGIALRGWSGRNGLPFPTWNYAPDYLPQGVTIPMAVSNALPGQPLLFGSPGNTRPDAWTDGRSGVRQHPAGLAEIARVHLDLPDRVTASDDLRLLEATGLVSLTATGNGPRMELTLSRIDAGPPRRLTLPDFTWSDPS